MQVRGRGVTTAWHVVLPRRWPPPAADTLVRHSARVWRSLRSLAFSELSAEGLRVTTAFGNDNRLTYTYGSAAAHVAVDPGTGDVELVDCLVVEDVGRIVNPLTLHGQAIGGMVQGLGGAFLEHLVYDANGNC